MADLNRVFLLGRLTRDPTLRHTPGGTPVAEFGIAVNRNWSGPSGERKEETCFVDIVVWSRRAEVCHANLKKASPVFVEGRLHLDTWSSSSGEKRSRLKVVANNVIFLSTPPRVGRVAQPRSADAGEGQPAGRLPAEASGNVAPPAEVVPPAEVAPPVGPVTGAASHPEDVAAPAESPPVGEEPRVSEDLTGPGAGSDFPF